MALSIGFVPMEHYPHNANNSLMKKSDINDIDKQIKRLAIECKKNELARSPTRNKRNGIELPLTGWMKGAKPNEPSKIFAVSECRARFQYSKKWQASEAIAQRIAKKVQLTDIQYVMLIDYILFRYRGNRPFTVSIPCFVLNTEGVCKDEIDDLISPLKPWKEPLNLIISKQFTDLILLKTLIKAAKGAKK